MVDTESYLEHIYNLFRSYYEPKYIGEKIDLRWDIEKLVLNGEQILDSGIADFSDMKDGYEDTIRELKREIRELEKFKTVYKTALKKMHKKLYKKSENYSYKIKRIRQIIEGKTGRFIDELRETIE